MPGFIRQKPAPALPHREPSAPKATKSSPAKKPAPKKRTVDLTSSPARPAAKKNAAPIAVDLTTPGRGTSRKRSSPEQPSSPPTIQQGAKKTRVAAPLKSASPKSDGKAAQKEAPLPSSLPANANDFLHDPSGLLPQLMESYNIATMQIISSSKMSAKIARSLDTLVLGKIDMADRNCKPGLVVLYSKAGTASKLVSIAEVVKREVGGKGGKWYQYSALSETMQVIPRKTFKTGKKEQGNRDGDADVEMKDGEGEEDESSYFETMKTKQERVVEGTDRMRAVPVLTVYLSRVPMEKLRMKFGEQTNAKN